MALTLSIQTLRGYCPLGPVLKGAEQKNRVTLVTLC